MAPTAPGRPYAPGNGNVMRSASSQQFLLSTRHTYEVKVDVFNGAGLNSTTVTKTVYVDTTPPNITLVRVWDEANINGNLQSRDTDVYGWVGGHHGSAAYLRPHPQTITCSWTGFKEDDTRIDGYRWAVTSSQSVPYHRMSDLYAPWDASYDDVMAWSDLTQNTLVAATNITLASLAPNVVYRCLVVAVNSAGLTSNITWSDGFTFDETHPINGTVIDSFDWLQDHSPNSASFRVDSDYTPEDRFITAAWYGFNDSEYGVRHSGSGDTGEIDSDHGWDSDRSVIDSLDELGVSHYEAGIGPCNEWQSLTLLPMNLSASHSFGRTERGGSCTWESVTTTSVCRLPHNSTYCSVVRAQNTHGLWGPRIRSDGVRVCTAGPTAGTVSDGVSLLYGEELDFTAKGEAELSWDGSISMAITSLSAVLPSFTKGRLSWLWLLFVLRGIVGAPKVPW